MPATATRKTSGPKAPPPGSKADLLERFKDFPGIKAWDRAWESPEGPGSLPILLVGEDPNCCTKTGHMRRLRPGATVCHLCKRPAKQWYIRHVNSKEPGRIAKVRAKGLIPVRLTELLQPDEIADLQKESPDGNARTGANGARILYKQPLELYNERKRRERDAREARSRNPKKVREDLATEAGSVLGSHAGDVVHENITFEETRVKTTLAEEAGGGDDE